MKVRNLQKQVIPDILRGEPKSDMDSALQKHDDIREYARRTGLYSIWVSRQSCIIVVLGSSCSSDLCMTTMNKAEPEILDDSTNTAQQMAIQRLEKR